MQAQPQEACKKACHCQELQLLPFFAAKDITLFDIKRSKPSGLQVVLIYQNNI